MDLLQGADLRRWLADVGQFGVERAMAIADEVLEHRTG